LQAYSLFRLQKFEEALKAVQQQPEDRSVARLNLQAQLHYRMGSSAEAIRIYHQLFKDYKVPCCQTTSLSLFMTRSLHCVSGKGKSSTWRHKQQASAACSKRLQGELLPLPLTK